jgi:hypothetical protein
MVIAQAPAPTIASVAGVTGEGPNSEAVIVLFAVLIGQGEETNIY